VAIIKKFLFIIIPLILIGGHLSQRIRIWYQVKKEVAEMKTNIERLNKEKSNLEDKKNYYQTEEFIRREAREKLGLTKNNELVLVLPELPELPGQQKGKVISPDSPVWKQWWDLFFTVN
jgi:cell division protein FtsB